MPGRKPPDSRTCTECGALIDLSETLPASRTKALHKSEAELDSGSVFAGRYKIIQELGRGGMGVVYKAKDSKLKRPVALKFLPPELARIPEAKERFLQEAQAAAALDYPHICTIFEADESENIPFISMAFIKGQSLRERIKSGSIDVNTALDIVIQVAKGLEEAHNRGIIHRDIKSDNIMITARGQSKIMDSGWQKSEAVLW
jgi:serine/threonine protein kinase